MRYDVKKMLFVGPLIDRAAFFAAAQKQGAIHFIDVQAQATQKIPEEIQNTTKAIKILRGLPPVEQEETENDAARDMIVREILHLKERQEKLHEEMRVLKLEISRIEVFGNFSMSDVSYLQHVGNRSLQFFSAKTGSKDAYEAISEMLYVDTKKGLDYFVAVNATPKQYEGMIEMLIDQPLGSVEKQLRQANIAWHADEVKLKALAKYNQFLHHTLVRQLNAFRLEEASSFSESAMEEHLFVTQGWVPVNRFDAIEKTAKDFGVLMEEIALEKREAAPTYLENRGAARMGEDLVAIYDTPSSTDADPSLWVFCAFALFFAFIVGDAGYGSVYLGLALYLRYKFPDLKGTAKRVLNLFTVLCGSCIVWGVLSTSFFGMEIGLDNPLRTVSLVHWLSEKRAAYMGVGPLTSDTIKVYADQVLFELALFFGVTHVILGCLRYLKRHWANLGWIMFLVGAYFYFPHYLGTVSMVNFLGGVAPESAAEAGLHLLMLGIPLALVLSLFQHRMGGLAEIATLIQVFGDVLSYLRLYALGLAGAIVSGTINQMAGAMPPVVALFLMIGAHLINMVLGIVSGLIHGLRLNFIEWYHYSFEGGGKKFAPLKLQEID